MESFPERRVFIQRCLKLIGLPIALPMLLPIRQTLAADLEQIEQPDQADPEHFIQRALAMRQLAIDTSDQAYGAIIVKDNRIVGQAPSRVIVNQDPTAHGEIEAIRDAAHRLGTHDLSGCQIYSSAKPCRMCETACYWANIDRIYHGTPTSIIDGGSPRYSSC